jgi:hypothetical protein
MVKVDAPHRGFKISRHTGECHSGAGRATVRASSPQRIRIIAAAVPYPEASHVGVKGDRTWRAEAPGVYNSGLSPNIFFSHIDGGTAFH